MCQAHMHTNVVSSPPLHPAHQGAQLYWPVSRMKSCSLLSALWIYISRKSWCHSLRAIINEELLILMSSCATTLEEEEYKKMAKNEQAIQWLQKQIRIRKNFFLSRTIAAMAKKKSDFISQETYCWIQVSYCSFLEKKKQPQTFYLKWSIYIATDNINGRSTIY